MKSNANAINKKMTPLYTPSQVYAIEKKWFESGNASFGLMQQAAWQMAMWIYTHNNKNLKGYVWVGSGNNGGDGWLVATYLKQLGADIRVIEVGQVTSDDAQLAQQRAQNNGIESISFEQIIEDKYSLKYEQFADATLFIDALFGIGLDRAPTGGYAQAIHTINENAKLFNINIVAIDVPSGLVASTGQVFNDCAVKADSTLCLVARKIGLHIKDGVDFSGNVVDLPLIPSVLEYKPAARLQYIAQVMTKRNSNSHKGSFGHVLIIGGNQVDGSQGMGGAAILSASSVFVAGVGKLTVACHEAFHGSLITTLPNAMTIDLHDINGVTRLIKQCDVVAIGMGLGRDDKSQALFDAYLESAMLAGIDIVIDADGLYHLAELVSQQPELKQRLASYSGSSDNDQNSPKIYYTPHSGEAARLIGNDVKTVEANRLDAVKSLADSYQGNWLLKGAGSIVIEQDEVYVCGAGNAGMATAGMGDVLSGLVAGLLAQKSMFGTMHDKKCSSLQQAVMIHAMAGDKLADKVGEWAVQASDMHSMIGQVLKELT